MPPSQPRRRSNSLPIPQIEISLYQGSGSRDSPSNSSLTNKDYIEVPDQPPSQQVQPEPCLQHQKSVDKGDDTSSSNGQRRPSAKKRVKMADLRTLIETKILSKSDRGLEKIGAEANGNGKRLQHAVICLLTFPTFLLSLSFSCHLSLRTSTVASTRARSISRGRHPTWRTSRPTLSRASPCHR